MTTYIIVENDTLASELFRQHGQCDKLIPVIIDGTRCVMEDILQATFLSDELKEALRTMPTITINEEIPGEE